MDNQLNLWVLKSVSEDERSYQSIEKYGDELQSKYVYDSSVANNKQIKAGDLVVIVNKKVVLGFAKISRIKSYESQKIRRRCPVCQSTNYESRKNKLPEYRCNKGHEFEEPISGIVPVMNYEALYGGSFQETEGKIDISALKPFYSNNYNRNMSIQKLSMTFFEKHFSTSIEKIQNAAHYPSPSDAIIINDDNEVYVPNGIDEREAINGLIRQRRGQKKFRDKLRIRYGDKCLISGCTILEIIEAAHINAYRSENDNNPKNGLLLRSDLHTLFDLDLLGIEPSTLKIHIHKEIEDIEYRRFDGLLLKCGNKKPSQNALEERWKDYLSNSK